MTSNKFRIDNLCSEALKSKSCPTPIYRESSFTLAQRNKIFRNLFASLDFLFLLCQDKRKQRDLFAPHLTRPVSPLAHHGGRKSRQFLIRSRRNWESCSVVSSWAKSKDRYFFLHRNPSNKRKVALLFFIRYIFIIYDLHWDKLLNFLIILFL